VCRFRELWPEFDKARESYMFLENLFEAARSSMSIRSLVLFAYMLDPVTRENGEGTLACVCSLLQCTIHISGTRPCTTDPLFYPPVLARQGGQCPDIIIIRKGCAMVSQVVPVPVPDTDPLGRVPHIHGSNHPPSRRKRSQFAHLDATGKRRRSHHFSDPRLHNVTVQLSDGSAWVSNRLDPVPRVLKGKVRTAGSWCRMHMRGCRYCVSAVS